MKKNIAIFASGSGSNAENIIRYFQKNDSAQVSLVLSNKSDAYVLERAHRLGVPCNVFTKNADNLCKDVHKRCKGGDRKSTRLNSSHNVASRMPSSA